jgi:hypothetical protein
MVSAVRFCADFAAVWRRANRDDGSADLFGKLKADVNATRQTRKTSAADALRTLLATRRGFCRRRDLLVQQKKRAAHPSVPSPRGGIGASPRTLLRRQGLAATGDTIAEAGIRLCQVYPFEPSHGASSLTISISGKFSESSIRLDSLQEKGRTEAAKHGADAIYIESATQEGGLALRLWQAGRRRHFQQSPISSESNRLEVVAALSRNSSSFALKLVLL